MKKIILVSLILGIFNSLLANNKESPFIQEFNKLQARTILIEKYLFGNNNDLILKPELNKLNIKFDLIEKQQQKNTLKVDEIVKLLNLDEMNKYIKKIDENNINYKEELEKLNFSINLEKKNRLEKNIYYDKEILKFENTKEDLYTKIAKLNKKEKEINSNIKDIKGKLDKFNELLDLKEIVYLLIEKSYQKDLSYEKNAKLLYYLNKDK